MAEPPLFNVTVAFAVVTGTAAGLLSLLTWRVFRHSPFGRVVFALSLLLFVFILYHVLLIASQSEPTFARVVFSVTYTALVAFIWLAVRAQRQLVAPAREGA